MDNSKRRGTLSRLCWAIVFVGLLVGAISVTPVLADSSLEPEPGGGAGTEAPAEPPIVLPGEVAPGGARIPTEAQMQATLSHQRELEERAQAERETPQAEAERQASMTAYEGATTGEAEELLRTQFGDALAELNSDPARFLSNATVERVFGDYAARVTNEGETTLMTGSMPIEAGEGAEQGKVDLGLEESAAGWEPENPLVPLTIGKTIEEGVEVGERITLTQIGVEEVEGNEFGDKNVFFGEVAADTDQLVSPTARGVELFDQLRSPASPDTLRFKVGMPSGAELRSVEGGAIVVGAGGGTIATIPPPTATDAQEATVSVDLAVEEDTIVLTVEAQGEVAYPILVDPEIDENLQWAWYSGNTAVMSNWVWAPGNSSGWLVPGYGDGSWPGTPGLFMWSNPGSLPGGSWGEWVLGTPNNATYMTSVTLSPLWRNNANCTAPNPYPEPYDYEGLWDGNQWDPIQYNQANEHGWALMGGMFNPGWGKQLVVGMGTTNGGYIPCYRHIMIGGFEAWLGDWANPVVYTPSGMPSGWLSGSSSFTLSVPSYDEGLGVAKTILSPEGAPPIQAGANCTGGYRSLCPHNFTGIYSLNGSVFDQGEHNAMVSAESPTLKGSGTYTFKTKVDRSPPEIALSNQLAEATAETLAFGQPEKPQAQGNDELSLPTYNLTVEARDGSLASEATKRSGVKEIEVELVGTSQKWKFTNSSCPASSCTLSGTVQIKLTEGLSAGLHKVKIIATDFVGNKEPREIEFEYLPATGIDGNGVLQYFPLSDGTHSENEDGPELAVNVVNGNLVFHQRDVNLEGAEANLEIERFYNSQLPAEQGTEWGKGWTLGQTPVLAPPTVAPGGTSKPHLMSTSSVNMGAVDLPAAPGQSYAAALHAMVQAEPGGGYAITGGDGDTTVLNGAGKTSEVQTGPYSSVNYGYSGGKLSEVAIEDLASTTLPPSAYQPTIVPVSAAPTFLSSFGATGTGNGQFSHPAGIARDAGGNIWVADSGNSRLEEFSEGGTFLKAIGSLGTGNGQFHTPKSIAFAANGNFWVADSANSRLEEFNAAGEFIKAVGSAGSANGQFQRPESLAIAPTGEIWVADTYNDRIEVLNAQGEFLRLVNPTGLGSIEPTGVAFAPGGKVWVADWAGNRVVEFTEAGEKVLQIGIGGTGNGQFAEPDTVAADTQGNLWVVDQNNERVQEFNPKGEYLSQFGSAGSGTGQFSFTYPTGIVTDAKGDIWVSDANNNRVQRWTTAEHAPVYTSSFGAAGTAGGQFSHPAGIDRDVEGNIWVADNGNNRVEKFSPSGSFLASFGSAGTAAGKFSGPKAIAFDNEGNFWVADAGNSRLEEFNAAGEFIKAVGSLGSGNGQFSRPESLAIAANGEIWVADTYNHRIEVLNEKGEFVKIVNPSGMGSIEPTGIAFGPGGKVWVADWAGNRVVELTQAGELVRSFGTAGSGSGQFARPDTISVDRKGGVWVVDQNNGRVQEFNQSGEYISQFGSTGSGTGQFSFAYPTGIVTDRQGDIWVTDANNNRVQRWRSANVLPEEIEPAPPAHDDSRLAVATTSGYVSSVVGAQTGTCSYTHEGELLTAVTCPSGTTTYAYDASNRMSKVTLPNGTYSEVKYDTMNRVTKVIVKQANEPSAKSTYFTWGNRNTVVEAPGQRATTYVIGNGGGVLKIYNSTNAPDFHDLAGTLYGFRETASPIEPGDQNLVVEAHSVEGIASIKMIANGNTVVDEKTCEQNYGVAGVECQIVPLEWVVNTGELNPGIMPIEVQLTDTLGLMTTQRFWVNIPYTPPPAPGVPTPPSFKSIQQFREEYDLDPDLNYATEELALHDRIFNLLGAWHNPQTPAGEVARASWERWGVPLRQVDVAELEYREWLYQTNSEKIDAWVEANQPANFGGYYLDNRAGGIMYVGFLGNQEEQLNQLKASLNLVAQNRVKVYPVAPTVSYLAAREAVPSIAQTIASTPVLRERVVEIRELEGGGGAQVETPEVSKVEQLLHEYLPGAPVKVGFESAGGNLLSGRFRNSGRMRAGDAIFELIPGAGTFDCTAGFGAKEKTGTVRGQTTWALFTLTAGHCREFSNAQAFYRSTQVTPAPTNDGTWSPIGLLRRDGLEANTFVKTDAGAIETNASELVPQGIFGEQGNLIPTKSAVTAKIGDTLCFSGAATRQPSCGKVVARSVNWVNEPGSFGRGGYWVKFPVQAVHGDSGAPVYTIFGHGVGLVTACRPINNCSETLVEPLLHPLHMPAADVPGIFNNPYLGQLSLKLGAE